MYKLFASPATASLAVHWMLIELGLPFDLEMLDFDRREQKSAAYLQLNSAGVVPTLIVDGQPVTETGAILMLLAERHPEFGFAPPPGTIERADWLRYMVWLANGPMATFHLVLPGSICPASTATRSAPASKILGPRRSAPCRSLVCGRHPDHHGRFSAHNADALVAKNVEACDVVAEYRHLPESDARPPGTACGPRARGCYGLDQRLIVLWALMVAVRLRSCRAALRASAAGRPRRAPSGLQCRA